MINSDVSKFFLSPFIVAVYVIPSSSSVFLLMESMLFCNTFSVFPSLYVTVTVNKSFCFDRSSLLAFLLQLNVASTTFFPLYVPIVPSFTISKSSILLTAVASFTTSVIAACTFLLTGEPVHIRNMTHNILSSAIPYSRKNVFIGIYLPFNFILCFSVSLS